MNIYINADVLSVICIAILCMFLLYYQEHSEDLYARKLFKNLRYYLPCTIKYKGHNLSIEEKEEEFKCTYFDINDCFNRNQNRMIIFINGNAIACITKTRYNAFYHYRIEYNRQYDHSDFCKIMKMAIKIGKIKKKEEFEKWNNERQGDNKKLYELVSQEKSACGNG